MTDPLVHLIEKSMDFGRMTAANSEIDRLRAENATLRAGLRAARDILGAWVIEQLKMDVDVAAAVALLDQEHHP